MKKRVLLLAVVLTIAAWSPAFSAKGPSGSQPPVTSMIENCPFYPCENFVTECENPGGTVLFLSPVTQCNFFGTTYTLYQGMCQFPPATFWDEVCFG
jgi:hypothetical protein